MVLRIGRGRGFGHSNRKTQGNGVINIVAPLIAGTLADGSTITCTPGTWFGGIPTRQWYRDGVAISGATGLTYTYVAATDDGCYLTVVEAVGTITATSNALISGINTRIYTTDFVGANGTDLQGYDGWTGGTAGKFQIQGNQLTQTGIMDYNSTQRRDFGVSDYWITMTILYPEGAPAADARTLRLLYARFSNNSNRINFTSQNNGWSLSKTVAGTTTTLQSFVSRTITSGSRIGLRVSGNYAKVYINDLETSQSAAANGGLGYLVSDVPLSNIVAPSGGGGSPLPCPFASRFIVDSVPANSISAASASVSSQESDGWVPRIIVNGSISGSVSQLQMLILSSTGTVLQDWTDVSGISGQSFSVTSPLLVNAAQGKTVTVWLRDKNDKKTTSPINCSVGYYASVYPTVIGLNESAWDSYKSVDPLNDLGKRGEWRTPTGPSGIYPATLADPITGNPAAYYGSDTYIQWVLDQLNSYGYMTPGAYDVTYPAGMTVTQGYATNATVTTPFSGGSGVITVSGTAGARIALNLSGTIPPGGAWIKFVKQGNTSTKLYTNTIKNDYQEAGFKIARFMTPYGTNDPMPVLPSGASLRQSANFGKGGLTPEYMVEFANDTGVDVWLNIHHLATDSYITAVANYFAANLNAPRKVWLELSNEMWNPGFASHDYSRMTGSALGFYNTNGDAAPSTIIPTKLTKVNDTTATSQQAFASGTRIYSNMNGTGWQVWEAVGDQPSGSTLNATSNANWTVIANNGDTALAGRRWQAKRSKEIFAIFDAAFGAAARTRTVRVLGAWALDTATTLSHRLLWGDLYKSLDRIATAPYWGTNLGNYSDKHIAGWGATEKALYSTDVAAWKNAFFSVVNADIDATVNTAVALKHSVEDMLRRAPYNLPADTIRMCSYECGWHVTMGNYPNLPLAATAFNSLRADSRCATAMGYYLDKIKSRLGGEHVIFDSVGSVVVPGSGYIQGWGIMYGQGDRTEPRYNAIKTWIAANI